MRKVALPISKKSPDHRLPDVNIVPLLSLPCRIASQVDRAGRRGVPCDEVVGQGEENQKDEIEESGSE